MENEVEINAKNNEMEKERHVLKYRSNSIALTKSNYIDDIPFL